MEPDQSRTLHGKADLNTHGSTSDSGEATLAQRSFRWVEWTVRMADLGSEACRTDTAAESALGFSAATAAVEVMTFETARMRRESQMLLGSELQLTRVMRAVSAVAGVAQSVTTATMSLKCWVLR